MLGAIMAMPQAMKDQIAGVAFYGYTQNGEQNGQIPNFPQNKLKVMCRQDDGVCGAQLAVTAGHLAYTNDGSIDQGAQFLTSMVQAAGGAATKA